MGGGLRSYLVGFLLGFDTQTRVPHKPQCIVILETLDFLEHWVTTTPCTDTSWAPFSWLTRVRGGRGGEVPKKRKHCMKVSSALQLSDYRPHPLPLSHLNRFWARSGGGSPQPLSMGSGAFRVDFSPNPQRGHIPPIIPVGGGGGLGTSTSCDVM